jgi:dolichyl-phosphate beta-glucosyltransferase
MRFSVIVPAYNEELRIGAFLKALLKFMESWRGSEVIVVNDGSRDNTLGVLKGFGSKIKVVSCGENRGKGWAVKEGMRAARGDRIIFMDADGSTRPDQLPRMLKALDHADMAIGTRRLRESQPFLRTALSACFNALARFLFRLHAKDCLCGFKGFRREAAKRLAEEVRSNRWEFDVELIARARSDGYAIAQVPIRWSYAEGSNMPIISEPPKMLFRLLCLRLRI